MNIKDMKLANAWETLHDLHKDDYVAAQASNDSSHCNACSTDLTPNGHITKAIEVIDKACETHMLCEGENHPDLDDDNTKRKSL